MIARELEFGRPGLLVSVRNADEASDALAGGADVIDVKEPSRGPLGPADAAIIAEVIRAVAGRAPVTAAAGELPDFASARPGWSDQPAWLQGVSIFKLGLAGCGAGNRWRSEWHQSVQVLSGSTRLAAVVYADWQAADAPCPDDVLAAAVEAGCRALLVDTWDKSAGWLLDHWPSDKLRAFVERVHAGGLTIGLAGSLTLSTVRQIAELGADLVAVRGAACDAGRGGTVSRDRVRALSEAITTASRVVAK